MKENKKAILDILKKNTKKDSKFENLVLSLALQKIDSDSFEFDGNLFYTADRERIVYGMGNAESIAIPEGVKIIGEMAFQKKKKLKNVIFPSSLEEIEKDAFYDCDELDSIFIPVGVQSVCAYAFSECDKLKTVTFEGIPKHISRHIFDNCEDLHTLFIPHGTEKTFRKALHCKEDETDFNIVEKESFPKLNSDEEIQEDLQEENVVNLLEQEQNFQNPTEGTSGIEVLTNATPSSSITGSDKQPAKVHSVEKKKSQTKKSK